MVGLGEERSPGSVLGCTEDIINTMVLVRVRFFTYSVSWMTSNRLLDDFLGVLWVAWAHFF